VIGAYSGSGVTFGNFLLPTQTQNTLFIVKYNLVQQPPTAPYVVCPFICGCPQPYQGAICNSQTKVWDFEGDVIVDSGQISITNSLTVVGDVILHSSSLYLVGGSLNITGCANVSNSVLTVNLTKQEIQSLKGQYIPISYQCIEGEFKNVSVVTSDSCSQVSLQQTLYSPKSMEILFDVTKSCSMGHSLPLWAVIVIAVLVPPVAIVIVVALAWYLRRKTIRILPTPQKLHGQKNKEIL